MRYRIGSRVHYRVYPSGLPATDIGGTVTDIGRHPTKRARLVYAVEWDDVDYSDATKFVASCRYMASDLAPIAPEDGHGPECDCNLCEPCSFCGRGGAQGGR